jgi:hypothetical protein
MSDEEDLLRDVVYDAIAAGRNSIHVAYNRAADKPAPDDAATYYVSFLLCVDGKTHRLLHDAAAKKERSVVKLVRRYCLSCFRFCIAEVDEEDEEELKDAA